MNTRMKSINQKTILDFYKNTFLLDLEIKFFNNMERY